MRKLNLLFSCLVVMVVLGHPLSYVLAAGPNLIANPSVESASANKPLNWTTNSWGSNNPTFTYEQTGNTGSKSLTVSVTNYANGDAKWMPDQVPVTAGEAYTYSDYIKSNVVTELDLAYKNSSGAMSFVYLASIPASSSWKKVTANFTVPAGMVSVAVYHIVYSNGSLTTDDFSLTQDSVTTPPADPTPPTDPVPPADPTPPVVTTGNLIANSSFEVANGADPSNWHRGGWGTNSSTFAYATGSAHSGSRKVTVAMSSYSNGDAKWYSDPVAVMAGSTYIYNDYYQSAVITRVVIAMTNTSGVVSYQELATAPASSSWALYNAKITVPSGIKSLTVYHLLDKVGSLGIDDVSLTADTSTTPPTPTPVPTPTPTGPNLIANPSFETASSSNSSTPANWGTDKWGSLTAMYEYIQNDAHSGTKSSKVTITNYSSGDAKWAFTPLANLTKGAQYDLSAWYKTSALPRVVATYVDTAGVNKYLELTKPLVGSQASTNWQPYNVKLTIPQDATNMSVYFLIDSNGWLMTDDFSLTSTQAVGFSEAMISLSFDDGFSSVFTNGLPILKKYNFPSTQYLLSGTLNTSSYMTTAMVQEFINSGHEIGSHTISHPDLTKLTTAQAMLELSNSQSVLRQLFGSGVANSFASPYGAYNSNTISLISMYYQTHRSTDVGYNTKNNFNPYNILVQNIKTDTTPAEVANWVAQAKADKSWLVIVYHDVSNSTDPNAYAVSASKLDQELSNIKTSGVAVKTISQAVSIIQSQL